jgi:uncharacterized protein
MSSRSSTDDFPGLAALADAFAHREPLAEYPDGPSPTLAALKNRRDEITALGRRHGARNLRVVGSVARGDAERDSDVDFLVDLEAGRSLLDVSGLVIDLEDLLGCRVHVVVKPASDGPRSARDSSRRPCLFEAPRRGPPERDPRGRRPHRPVHRARPRELRLRRDAAVRDRAWPVLIGEAAGRLWPELRGRPPDVPWRQIVGQRNVVVHEYDRIDLDIVWNVAVDEVPRLADRIRSILEAEQ